MIVLIRGMRFGMNAMVKSDPGADAPVPARKPYRHGHTLAAACALACERLKTPPFGPACSFFGAGLPCLTAKGCCLLEGDG